MVIKKNWKRGLAWMLVLLLFCGFGSAGGAAPYRRITQTNAKTQDSSLTIDSQPTQTPVVHISYHGNVPSEMREYYWVEFNPEGFAFTASGSEIPGGHITVTHESLYKEAKAKDEMSWQYEFHSANESGLWEESDTEGVFQVTGYRAYSYNFHVEKVIDGVEYGYYETQEVFYDTVRIPVTVVVENRGLLWEQQGTLRELVPDEPLMVSNELLLFRPTESGYYRFASTGGIANDEGWLHDREGNYLSSRCDPLVYLYASDGYEIGWNDDGGYGRNFVLNAQLTAGETYYVRVEDITDNDQKQPFQISVRKYAKKLSVNTKTVWMNYHDSWSYTKFLSKIGRHDSVIHYTFAPGNSKEQFDGCVQFRDRVEADKLGGPRNIMVFHDDGSFTEVKVRVGYSPLQWFFVIFGLGFLWMKHTVYGSFHPLKELWNVFNPYYDYYENHKDKDPDEYVYQYLNFMDYSYYSEWD